MINKISLPILLIVVGGISVITSLHVGSAQTEENKALANESDMSNTSAIIGNNTISLNAKEVGEEQYRWVNSSGGENPTLSLKANDEYSFVISNPTDEKHQLVIESQSNGKVSKIAESGDIDPQSKGVEFKFKTDQTGELRYHCEYHPNMMKGTITVTE